ncbi:hypothetical protein BKA63DRAFT_276557 [Paraphoma chrysanthemicola]|nr:hypothetical protein BKA63DRAFT_276557 [Paraphoma chrysanthemicola]
MAAEVAAEAATTWDEAQCKAALAQFEQLQAQLDDLRLAIPRIIDPLHRPPSPTAFKLYAQGALGSQSAVKSLHENWKDPSIQKAFEYTNQSYAENMDLTESRSIPAHGWIEREKKERSSIKSSRSDSTDESVSTLTDEDVNRIVEDFQKTYPGIKLETQDENRAILTSFVSQGMKLKFRVTIERETTGRQKLNGECSGTIEPFLSITRCIASRPQTNDLKHLLDMIAAYKTVKGVSCEKCGNLLDHAMMTPTARRPKSAVANTLNEVAWTAWHESCLS